VKRELFLAGLVMGVAGCAAGTMTQLEAEGDRVVVGSPLPWQEAYRRLNTRMRACLAPSSLLGGSLVQVDGQLYDELRMGEIAVTFPTGPFSSTNGPLARVQVRPADSGAEVVILTVGNVEGRSIAKRVPKWLDGHQECQ
jgi:hypothetical protein